MYESKVDPSVQRQRVGRGRGSEGARGSTRQMSRPARLIDSIEEGMEEGSSLVLAKALAPRQQRPPQYPSQTSQDPTALITHNTSGPHDKQKARLALSSATPLFDQLSRYDGHRAGTCPRSGLPLAACALFFLFFLSAFTALPSNACVP